MPMSVAAALSLPNGAILEDRNFLEQEVTKMRHTFRFQDPCQYPINREGEEPQRSLWMVQRSVFDNEFTQRAVHAGAELKDQLVLRTLEVDQNNKIQVRAEGQRGSWEATTDFLIGADGANGITAKLAGLRKNRLLGIAMEAEIHHDWSRSDLHPDTLHLDYGSVPNGYAWVFPKRDHLNVGAGVFRQRRSEGHGDSSLRERLQATIREYLQSLNVTTPEPITFHAHPIPVWNGLEQVISENGKVLLVGDAAGLVQPLFGDGILHAIKSGNLAANAILANKPTGYQSALKTEFKASFDAAAKVADLFHQFPALSYRYGVKHPEATYWAGRLFCGDIPFQSIQSRIMKRLRKVILTEPNSTPTT